MYHNSFWLKFGFDKVDQGILIELTLDGVAHMQVAHLATVVEEIGRIHHGQGGNRGDERIAFVENTALDAVGEDSGKLIHQSAQTIQVLFVAFEPAVIHDPSEFIHVGILGCIDADVLQDAMNDGNDCVWRHFAFECFQISPHTGPLAVDEVL